MGESKRKQRAALMQGNMGDKSQAVDTLGGRMHVRWDGGAAAMPHGQLVFFAEFLATTGVFERWVSSCPLEYRSGNANYKALKQADLDHPIETVGARLRARMPWLDPAKRAAHAEPAPGTATPAKETATA